jgi:Tol biopolymer transport system component
MGKTVVPFASLAVALVLAGGVALLGAGGPAKAAFPGENGKIVFVSGRDGDQDIYTSNLDGTGLKKLTHNSRDDNSPSWSADGRRIVYVSGRYGPSGSICRSAIRTTNANGTDKKSITSLLSCDFDPAFSPSGRRIVFARGASGLRIVNANGNNLIRLTNNTHDEARVWSPDGSKIAFQSYGYSTVSDPFDIGTFTINPDGSGRSLVADDAFRPDWSPDGTRLTYTCPEDPSSQTTLFEIHQGDGACNEETRLTTNSGFDGGSVFSPEGDKIVFVSDRGGDFAMYTMNADGSGVEQLTMKGGAPDWRPLQ